MVVEHAGHEAGMCDGLSYALPKGFYVPLRNAHTKNGKSMASNVYGSKPNPLNVKYRNPRMYIQKHGDRT